MPWLERFHREPWAFDFFAFLRRAQARWQQFPLQGEALLPSQEPVRVVQDVSLDFPATVFRRGRGDERSDEPVAVVAEQAFFGYFGANGPLPSHLTDFVRMRLLHQQDATMVRFLEMFAHRFALHFFRAWSQSQATLSFDRPRSGQERDYLQMVESLGGMNQTANRGRDALHDHARLFHSGWLHRQTRNTEGLCAMVAHYFRVEANILPWLGKWQGIHPSDRSYLGIQSLAAPNKVALTLGLGQPLGKSIYLRQSQFELILGPLDLSCFEHFLPRGKAIEPLLAMIREYTHGEFEVHVRLILKAEQVPSSSLRQAVHAENKSSKGTSLGWTSWLGTKPRSKHASMVSVLMTQLGPQLR